MSVTQDILKKIEEQIQEVKLSDELSAKGQILEIRDGVATVTGLQSAMFSEIVVFENGTKGLVLDLLEDSVGVLILGNYGTLEQGQIVSTTGKVFSVGVGEEYLGRVVDGIGNPIDGKGDIKAKEFSAVEKVAPGVMAREGVNQPLQTGIKAIDTMVPIGRGQRELIIGDRQTGKTTVAIDTILNQKGQNVYCIYVAIGQKESKVRRLVETLQEKGAMDYTIVVSAPANTPSVMQYIAPYVGCSFGEYFMNTGRDALIIYDDLSKHAVAYREVSLLLRRPPGREAYPGDVFLSPLKTSRACCESSADYLKEISGGKITDRTGSLTALPIIETQAGDISAYVPTNVISITDGQIFLETDLFNAGVRPAVNTGLSVSRVGGSAQTKIVKKVSGTLKLELANARELQAFAQFASDLDATTVAKIDRGNRLTEMLKQGANEPRPFPKQAVLVYAGVKGYLDKLEVSQVLPLEKIINDKLDSSYKSLFDTILEKKELSGEVEEEIKKLLDEAVAEVK